MAGHLLLIYQNVGALFLLNLVPRNPVEVETIEICQSQWAKRQQYLCLPVNIQNTQLT